MKSNEEFPEYCAMRDARRNFVIDFYRVFQKEEFPTVKDSATYLANILKTNFKYVTQIIYGYANLTDEKCGMLEKMLRAESEQAKIPDPWVMSLRSNVNKKKRIKNVTKKQKPMIPAKQLASNVSVNIDLASRRKSFVKAYSAMWHSNVTEYVEILALFATDLELDVIEVQKLINADTHLDSGKCLEFCKRIGLHTDAKRKLIKDSGLQTALDIQVFLEEPVTIPSIIESESSSTAIDLLNNNQEDKARVMNTPSKLLIKRVGNDIWLDGNLESLAHTVYFRIADQNIPIALVPIGFIPNGEYFVTNTNKGLKIEVNFVRESQ